jgi:hypothetical protein
MNEAETRAEHIDPALKAAGWGVVEGSKILREYPITPGRIEGHGRRGKPPKPRAPATRGRRKPWRRRQPPLPSSLMQGWPFGSRGRELSNMWTGRWGIRCLRKTD